MNLKRRLLVLEQVVTPVDRGRCDRCGYEPGSELKCKVLFHDEPLEGPDVCSRCGRPLILRLEFDSPLEIDRPSVVPPSGRRSYGLS